MSTAEMGAIQSKIRIVIPGDARGQPRPKVTTRGAIARAYHPTWVRQLKDRVKEIAVTAMAGRDPLQGPVEVVIVAYVTLPKSHRRKTKPKPRVWRWIGTDVDNIAKLYMDAITGVVYLDDRQVCSLRVLKLTEAQGTPGRTVMVITDLTDTPLPV